MAFSAALIAGALAALYAAFRYVLSRVRVNVATDAVIAAAKKEEAAIANEPTPKPRTQAQIRDELKERHGKTQK